MGLFKTYETDKKLELEGVVFTPDSNTAITVARGGGANVHFAKALERKSKPLRRQIEAGILDLELDRKMMAEVYAETIIKNWETLITVKGKPSLVQGIEANPEAPEGTYSHAPDEHGLVPFNKQNVVSTLRLLPDLLVDIQRNSQDLANFRIAERKEDEGN